MRRRLLTAVISMRQPCVQSQCEAAGQCLPKPAFSGNAELLALSVLGDSSNAV